MTAQEFLGMENKYYIYIKDFFAVPMKYRVMGYWVGYQEVPMIQVEFENGVVDERNINELMSCYELEDCKKQCEVMNKRMGKYRNMWERDKEIIKGLENI